MQWGPGVDPTEHRPRRRQDGRATPATRRGPRAAPAAICRSRPTGRRRRHHYEGGETRNFATYNPQVARDDMFQLGLHGTGEGRQDRADPLQLGARPVLDQHQPRAHLHPAAADLGQPASSSQAFAPHYPHTERKIETKTCTDCHVSQNNDNNAIMAQLLLHGTNFVNFVGYNAWVGEDKGDRRHAGHRVGRAAGGHRQLSASLRLSGLFRAAPEARSPTAQYRGACRPRTRRAACSLRGEYLYVAEGHGGMRVYDVASIANKGVRSKDHHRAVLAARAGHAYRLEQTRPAWRCRPTSRSTRCATRAT